MPPESSRSLEELAAALEAERGVRVHPSSISRALVRRDLTYQKRSLIATERERDDVQAARDDWAEMSQPGMRKAPHRLGFVDECGCGYFVHRARHAEAPKALCLQLRRYHRMDALSLRRSSCC